AGSGDDTILGLGSSNHFIDGGAGNDLLAGGAGNDYLVGGADNDRLAGGDGDDTLSGGSGNDPFFTSPRVDTAGGGAGTAGGADYSGDGAGIHVDLGNNTVRDDAASHDTISGVEVIIGSGFADTIIGDAENNVLYGGAFSTANPTITGVDILQGAAG